ncbi:MAG: hypothetical protein QMA97_05655, partial [Glaciecola sp.]
MKALIRFLLISATSIMLFACGGSGDTLSRDASGGAATTADPDPVSTYSVTLSISDAQGNA